MSNEKKRLKTIWRKLFSSYFRVWMSKNRRYNFTNHRFKWYFIYLF